jgi:hypothetical protein
MVRIACQDTPTKNCKTDTAPRSGYLRVKVGAPQPLNPYRRKHPCQSPELEKTFSGFPSLDIPVSPVVAMVSPIRKAHEAKLEDSQERRKQQKRSVSSVGDSLGLSGLSQHLEGSKSHRDGRPRCKSPSLPQGFFSFPSLASLTCL